MPYMPQYSVGGTGVTPNFNVYPQPYQYQMPIQQSYAQGSSTGIIWVDGEVGAKAYQLPAGQNGPVALWDTNDTVIYLKSMNQMGMPNPIQKIHYTIEETKQNLLPGNGQSGTAPQAMDQGQYITKDDFEKFKKELKDTISSMSNQNGSYNNTGNVNRGGRGNA